MKNANTTTKKYPHKSLQNLESTRAEFLVKYRRHDFLKKIVFFICLLALIAGLIIGSKIQGGFAPAITFGLPIIALAIMLVYGMIVKRMMEKKLRAYFTTYYRSINEYTLSDKSFKNVILGEPGKITKEEFCENLLYKNVFEVGSRGLTNFTYNKMDATIVDCAAQIKGAKRVQPVFVGKYLTANCSYKGKQPIVIYLKGTGVVLPPTNVDNMRSVLDNEKMVIYTNYTNWKKVVGTKIINLLGTIKTNKLLVDFTISMHDGKQYVCMGYDDPIMVPPLEQEFNSKPTEQFKKELELTLKLMEALN